MSFGPVVDELIDALKILPSVGQKSAQRMALMLLVKHKRPEFFIYALRIKLAFRKESRLFI